MNPGNFTETILRVSGQASILIAIVLMLQWLLSSRIPAAWRYALWLPVILRLLLPIVPESRLSLFNLLSRNSPAPQRYQVSIATVSRPAMLLPIPDESLSTKQPEHFSSRFSALEIIGALWLAVALLLMARFILGNRKFARALSQCEPIRDGRLFTICDAVREELQVRRKVELIEHPNIGSPALFGAIRPRLLLPPELDRQFSDLELRHIFLHELAHLKRGDLYMNWVLLAAQALHWFNPLVWFTYQRIKADREFACDVMALERLPEGSAEQFGETMLKILQLFSSSSRAVGTMSIISGRGELKRRLRMIGNYRTTRNRSLVWAVLLLLLSFAGLSDAQPKKENSSSPAAQPTLSDQNRSQIIGNDLPEPSRQDRFYSGTPGANLSPKFPRTYGTKQDWDWLQDQNPWLKTDWSFAPEAAPQQPAYYSWKIDLKNPKKPVEDPTLLVRARGGDSAMVEDLQKKMEIAPDGSNPETPSTPKSGARLIWKKVNEIRLEEFSVPEETSLPEVIKQLSGDIKKNDPTGRGINLIISWSNNQPKINDYKIKIMPPRKNIRLIDVFDAIGNGATDPKLGSARANLQYSIQDYAVVFTAPNQPLERRKSNQVNSIYSSSIGLDAAEAQPIEQLSTNEPLYTRTFKLNSTNFLKSVRNRLHHADNSTTGWVSEVRDYFSSLGLDFLNGEPNQESSPAQPKKSMFFNERTGILLVRATLSEIELIESIVVQANQTSPALWEVKMVLRVPEINFRSSRSAMEIVSDAVASFSNKTVPWKTNALEHGTPVNIAVINDQDSKALFKSLEKRRDYDLMTTREMTIPSGSEAIISMGGDSYETVANKLDLHLIPTVLLGDTVVLSAGFEFTDTGKLDSARKTVSTNATKAEARAAVDVSGPTFSTNAIAYLTRKVSAVARASSGDTVILSVPRAFADGKDFLLFITPEIRQKTN